MSTRNRSCPCGSGHKYKNCCLLKSSTVWTDGQSWPLLGNKPFLYRQAFQCIRVQIDKLDDVVAIKLGDVIVHLTTKPQAATVFAGAPEISNDGRINRDSMKSVNLQFQGNAYLLLSYEADTSEAAKTGGRERFEVVLGFLQAALGQNLSLNPIFEVLTERKTNSLIWESDAILDPRLLPMCEIKDPDLEAVISAWESMAPKEPAIQNRLELALRHYQRGLLEHVANDKYLFFWVAFEVLAMPDATNITVAATDIKNSFFPALTAEEVKLRLGLVELYGCRNDIVHNGLAVMKSVHDGRIERLRIIVRELIRAKIGRPSMGAVEGLATPASENQPK